MARETEYGRLFQPRVVIVRIGTQGQNRVRQGTLLFNLTALVSSQALIKLINFAVSIAVVRYLGAQELGRYAYVLAFAYPFGILADFGLATYAIREISRDPARESEIVASLWRALLLLSGVGSAAMMSVAIMAGHDTTTMLCMGLAALSMLLSAATTPFIVVLTAREDLHLVSMYRVVTSILVALATVIVLLQEGASLGLLTVSAAVNGLMLVFARFLAGSAPSSPAVLSTRAWTMIRQALPFGLLMLGYALYYRVDMIMLHWLREPRDVGLYAAAYRFLDAVIILAASIGGPFYPRLSSMVGRDQQGVRNLLEGTWKPLLVLGLPVMLGTYFLADSLAQALFGDEFVEAGVVLKVLILGSMPLIWINIPNQALLAADVVLPLARVYGLSVLVNVLLNIVLIPRWGPVGAAVATVACEWLNLALVVRMVRREFGLSFSYEGLWRYILAALAMSVVVWLGRDMSLAVVILLGLVAYAGGLMLLGFLRSPDLLTVRRLLTQ